MSHPDDGSDHGIRHSLFVGVGIAFLIFLYLFSPFTLVFVGWFVDFEDNISHHVHELTFGALFAIIFVGVFTQLRSNTRNFAGLVQAAVAAVTLSVVVTLTTGWEWPTLLYLAPLIAVMWLHPDRQSFWRFKLQPHRRLVILMGLISFSLLWGFVKEFDKAANEVRFHTSHWAGMAAFALTVLIIGYLAAFRVHGWPLLAWTTGASVGLYGVLSLAYPFDASARPGATGVLSVIWGGFFIFTARSARPVPAVARQHPANGPVESEVALASLSGPRRGLRLAAGASIVAVATALTDLLILVPVVVVVAALFVRSRIQRRSAASRRITPSSDVGSQVHPSPGSSSRLWTVARSGLGFAGIFVIGMFGAAVARSFVAPPVPHIIETLDLNSCITCHVTGEEHAPTIDWRTHNAFEGNWARPQCSDCHDLPKLTTSGALTVTRDSVAGPGLGAVARVLTAAHLDAETADQVADVIRAIQELREPR